MYSHDFQDLMDRFHRMIPANVMFKDKKAIRGYVSAMDVRSGLFSMIGLTVDEFHDDLAISDVIMVEDINYPIVAGKSVYIYVDDERSGHPEKDNEIIVKSVKEAQHVIEKCRELGADIECIDLDHDLGNYEPFGGDAINLVYYLIENELFYTIALHTANSTGHDNMKQVIERYWPEEDV